MRIGIAVGHPHPSEEQLLLHDLYDPRSASFHRFLTPAQYAARFGVTKTDSKRVEGWLTGNGLHVDYRTNARDYVLASGTTKQIEALTKTSIGAYRYGKRSFVANDAPPRIPASLPVFSILGLNTYERFHTMQAPSGPPSVGSRTPQQLWNIYQQPADHTGQGVSVAILGQGATDGVIKDLHTFDTNNKLPQLPVTVVHTPTNGDFSDTSGNGEWNIDMQAVHGMAPGISKEVLYFAPSLADTDLVASTATWVNDPSGPPIMNASLGECEVNPLNPTLNNDAFYPINGNENQGSTPVSQGLSNSSEPAQAMLLQQAVMEGRTFFASSGDAGSSCGAIYAPVNTNGVVNQAVPLTEDPANQPFAVGVGGTVLYADSTAPDANRLLEYAWTHSGGNASPFVTAPDYQQGVPNLDRTCISDQSGNPTNTGKLCRGVPDVAALSGDVATNGYDIVSDGQASTGGGTSLSSPLWAGMWARVVGTAPAGSSGYGFANYAIYKIAKDPIRYARSFNDVTVGSNGLNNAMPGYDYVTGFGTPNVSSLIGDVQAVAPAVTGSSGTSPVGSGGNAGSQAPRCADKRAPVTRYKGKHSFGRKRLSFRGTTSDKGCGPGGHGSVRVVKVSLARTTKRGCQYMDARGRLTKRRSCRRPLLVNASGHTSWRFDMRVHLPRGYYRVVARGYDTAGNKERPHKSDTLKFRLR
jgi:pseudomonalisin